MAPLTDALTSVGQLTAQHLALSAAAKVTDAAINVARDVSRHTVGSYTVAGRGGATVSSRGGEPFCVAGCSHNVQNVHTSPVIHDEVDVPKSDG